MLQPGRSFSSEGYRYRFNTLERVDEIYCIGNSYTAEYWLYDARIVRRWNLDPIPQIRISDYATFTNNPIYYIDPEGDIFRSVQRKQAELFNKKVNGTLIKTGRREFLVKYTNVEYISGTEEIKQINYTEAFFKDREAGMRILSEEGFDKATINDASHKTIDNIALKMAIYEASFKDSEGFTKTNEIVRDLGASLLLTPLAPIGELLIVASMVLETGIDFLTKPTQEAIKNLGIRIANLGAGKLIKGGFEKVTKNVPEFKDKKGSERIFDFGQQKGMDKIEESLIKE